MKHVALISAYAATVLAALACVVALSGCATVDRINARRDYKDAVADYRACIKLNPDNPRVCDSELANMNAQQALFHEMNANQPSMLLMHSY